MKSTPLVLAFSSTLAHALSRWCLSCVDSPTSVVFEVALKATSSNLAACAFLILILRHLPPALNDPYTTDQALTAPHYPHRLGCPFSETKGPLWGPKICAAFSIECERVRRREASSAARLLPQIPLLFSPFPRQSTRDQTVA